MPLILGIGAFAMEMLFAKMGANAMFASGKKYRPEMGAAVGGKGTGFTARLRLMVQTSRNTHTHPAPAIAQKNAKRKERAVKSERRRSRVESRPVPLMVDSCVGQKTHLPQEKDSGRCCAR